ncbi:Hypothetical protein NTJ_04988 [Nesidiocoris tenuis]|uniref:Uncharacterized protein n=1 Tax=Nesidiocoris tenuis TaxID=355587 RepID=A0ABN7AIU0_9HEMI|nr:Hypothetical protein NTJ_04988 [Nesidiocoris tenuis]
MGRDKAKKNSVRVVECAAYIGQTGTFWAGNRKGQIGKGRKDSREEPARANIAIVIVPHSTNGYPHRTVFAFVTILCPFPGT